MDNILELDCVSKEFSQSNFAIDKVSFSLPYGAIMGFVGENGAGKTTTIGCIMNTITRDAGTVKLFGREMTDKDVDLRENIGIVYDGDNFPNYLNAIKIENIMQGLYSNWDSQLYWEYLNRFHISVTQKIKSYSRGMTMKLAISVALSHHPQLLILDEATSGLDPVLREEILDIFLEFVQEDNHSILLSSHITSDLEKIADYITFIHDGKIIMSSSKDSLIYDYAVLRCKESQFKQIASCDVVAYRKKDFQIDVLVADRKQAARKYKDVIIDHVSIDDILLLLVKGERI